MHLGLGLTIGNPVLQVSGPTYEPEATSYFAAMTTQPDATRKGHINALIAALKTAGVWTDLDLLYLYAAHDAQAAGLNVKNPAAFVTVPNNAPTHTADRGYQGDGMASYLSTQYNPTTDAVQLTQNNASCWWWSLTDVASASGDIGNVSGTRIYATPLFGGNLVHRCNDATAGSAANASSTGFFGIQRRGATDKRAFKNGAQIGSTLTTASTGLTNQILYACGANSGVFSPRQLAIHAIGSALVGKELAFYNAISDYMSAIGAI